MTDQATARKTESAPAPIPRTFLTVEIRGGEPKMINNAVQIITLELESAVLLVRNLQFGRKGAPEIEIHPLSVEA
jgi:hypothetical protein